MKITRRTKLLVVALALCFTTMIGSTVAWFTDSVESAGNTIEAGNLDIKLEYKTNDTYAEVTNTTKLFNDAAKWEPGHVEVAYLKITNAGNLALNYKLNVNVASETAGTNVAGNSFKLSDYLVFKVVESDSENIYADRAAAMAAAGTTLGLNAYNGEEKSMTIQGEVDYVALIVYMPETVGNEANHNGTNVPSIKLGVKLDAKQMVSESDGFGTDYDKDALYPGEAAVSTVDELKKALENGDKAVLTDDIELTSTLMTKKDAVIDLNGNTIKAPSSGAMFQSQSNAAPDITITSSKPDAEINVTGGDTSVLLGYGSTVINNVTINVSDCDNKSPNPFKVYGDLTLGEGTVVNIDYLGTALISNNGAVDIVIDGAEINIDGPFKTNGTAIITLNQASTLKMKNTSVNIDEFVLSPFGGDSLVSKADGVEIESCTFDVTDSNGASCTFVAKDGKYRLVQK